MGLKKWSLDIAIVKATWKYFRFFEVGIIGIKNEINLCNFGVTNSHLKIIRNNTNKLLISLHEHTKLLIKSTRLEYTKHSNFMKEIQLQKLKIPNNHGKDNLKNSQNSELLHIRVQYSNLLLHTQKNNYT